MGHIREQLAAGKTLSFEFFPPRTEGALASLRDAVVELAQVEPDFVSVTCGAGGTSHEVTRDIVVEITSNQGFPAMAHLTCVGHSRADVDALLADYTANGVRNILALAGDPPADGSEAVGDFRYASELVEVIRAHPGDFSIGVAAHPELHPRSPNRADDRAHLAAKLGRADFAVTQFFFEPADYFAMVEDLAALGAGAPIVPGVFPVTVPATVRRFAAMNNTRVPEDLFARIEAADPADRVALAVEHAADLAQRLLDGGAPGIHLYTMNRSEAALAIVAHLGLR